MATKVLIVDDEGDMRELLTLMVRSLGGLVQAVPTGQEALIQAAANPPDLIILDILMPGVDGYTTAARLRSTGYTGYILFLSALSVADGIHPVDPTAGVANAYERKPISKAKLADYLAKTAAWSVDQDLHAKLELPLQDKPKEKDDEQ